MKKIYLLFLLCPLLLLQSCLKDEKDIFTEPAAVRLSNRIKADKEVLTGAANGWILSYYPEKNKIYGGYNLFIKFNTDNSVNVSSELCKQADSVVTSYYDIIPETGPLLTFNTHNGFIHYFSDPKNPDGIGTADGGMKGDYEFIVIEATAEKVTLKGKKTGNIVYMQPIANNANWQTDMQKHIAAAAEHTYYTAFTYSVGNKLYNVSTSYRTLSISHRGEDNLETQTIVPFAVTLDGIKFYETLDFDGIKVNEMKYNKVNDTTVFFEDTNGSGAKLIAAFLPLNAQFIRNNWYFYYSGIGTHAAPAWDKVKDTLTMKIGEELRHAFIGTQNGYYGFCFNSNGKIGELHYSYSLPTDPTKIKLVFANTVSNRGLWYWINAAFNLYVNALGRDKTFTITGVEGNPKLPTKIKITDDANAANTYILSKTKINYPYRY